MSWTRWRQITRYLIWLPPIVLLCVCGTYPILPSGDRRNGTWQDPRELTADLAVYYLAALVIFRLSRRLIRGGRGVIRARNDRFDSRDITYDYYPETAEPLKCGSGSRLRKVNASELATRSEQVIFLESTLSD